MTDPQKSLTLQPLYDQAFTVASHSYSPYSHFRVGAAIRLNNGEIVTGTNVENVSFGLTLCAERSALVQAVSRFGASIRIEAFAVANRNEAPSPPCGACLQMLSEFVTDSTIVLYPGPEGLVEEPFGNLLPRRFHFKH